MIDTELRPAGSDPVATETDLEVDQFFSGMAIEPDIGGTEASFCDGIDGQVYLVHFRAKEHELALKASSDRGRTWGAAWPMRDRAGKVLKGHHVSVFRLSATRLGLIYSDPGLSHVRPGRDGGHAMAFRTSDDEGHTWSDLVNVEPYWSLCIGGHALVLKSGRILAPTMRWISHDPGNMCEFPSVSTLTYSYACFSDDEGRSWKSSFNELFVSIRKAAYDLEEPTVIELSDGRLLCHLRSQLGRPYRAYSSDQGATWTPPEPMNIASSYAPCALKRIPGTDHLLMVWNQCSAQEIQTGLHRHRLSCAISKDSGQTWENFKNLESLDLTTQVRPPALNHVEVIEQWENYGYYQPNNVARYPRAPGVLRICYPNVLFSGDEALICYDYGYGTLGEGFGIKIRTIPIGWFIS